MDIPADSYPAAPWFVRATKHTGACIIGIFGLLLCITSIALFVSAQSHTAPIVITKQENTGMTITIDIAGAVVNPGVYTMPLSSRLDDVIAKAGGFTDNADLNLIERTVNRARLVKDGEKIFFPETHADTTTPDTGENLGVSIISINTASQKELESLSGVGEVTAKKIIDNRPYYTLDELTEKKVVSTSLFEKIYGEIGL